MSKWREALRILMDNGLRAKPLVDLEVSTIRYEGENVGFMQEDLLYLCSSVPSIVERPYGLVSKSRILFSDPNWKAALLTAIDILKGTVERYENEKRKEKIEAVQSYFDVRKRREKRIMASVKMLKAEYIRRRSATFMMADL